MLLGPGISFGSWGWEWTEGFRVQREGKIEPDLGTKGSRDGRLIWARRPLANPDIGTCWPSTLVLRLQAERTPSLISPPHWNLGVHAGCGDGLRMSHVAGSCPFIPVFSFLSLPKQQSLRRTCFASSSLSLSFSPFPLRLGSGLDLVKDGKPVLKGQAPSTS